MINEIPYPGFRSFKTEESYLFFGREGLTDEIIERLRKSKFVAVTGVSGSGKSSLVKAGLVPDLRIGLLSGARSNWVDIQFSPEGQPVENLLKALKESFPLELEKEIPYLSETTIKARTEGLADYYELADSDDNLLIVVDQFEELFQFEKGKKENAEEALYFAELLLKAAESDLPIYVVITMRSDFLGDCARFSGLLEMVNKSQYLVPRLKIVDLTKAIEEPAKICCAKLTPALLSSMLNDVMESQHELPRLQHALRLTWLESIKNQKEGQPEADHLVKLQHYEQIGGLKTSLNNHAEAIYEELSEDEKLVVEDVFKTVTELGPERKAVRKPILMRDLQLITGYDFSVLRGVIDQFREDGKNFLLPFGDELTEDSKIDISHESLIPSWERLSDWVDFESKAVNRLHLIYSRLELGLHEKSGEELKGLDLDLAKELVSAGKFNSHWVAHVMPVSGFNEENYKKLVSDINLYVRASIEADNDLRTSVQDEAKKKAARKGTITGVIVFLISLITVVVLFYIQQKESVAQAKRRMIEAQVAADSISTQGRMINTQLRILADEIALKTDSLEKNYHKVRLNNAKANELSDSLTIAFKRSIQMTDSLKVVASVLVDSTQNENRKLQVLIDSSSTKNLELQIAIDSNKVFTERLRSDINIYQALEQARREFETGNFGLSFRYAEHVHDCLDPGNTDAESFMRRAFFSSRLGGKASDFTDEAIIVFDANKERIDIGYPLSKSDTISFPIAADLSEISIAKNYLLFYDSNDSIAKFNIVTHGIQRHKNVKEKVKNRLHLTDDERFILGYNYEDKIDAFDESRGGFSVVVYDMAKSVAQFSTADYVSRDDNLRYYRGDLYLFSVGDYKYNFPKNDWKKVRVNDYKKRRRIGVESELLKWQEKKVWKNSDVGYVTLARPKIYRASEAVKESKLKFSLDTEDIQYWVNKRALFGLIEKLTPDQIARVTK